MNPWIREGELYRCPRHGGEPFGADAPCASCAVDPGEPFDLEVDAPLSKPPRGCQSSEQHERQFTELARFARSRAAELARTAKQVKPKKLTAAERKDPKLFAAYVELELAQLAAKARAENTAVKWADIAIKARRAAAAQSGSREYEEIVRRREKRQRARDRGVAN
ncbi:MAG TPA: hypothetical protein VGG74_11730 [Kofleriaceae bacterium]